MAQEGLSAQLTPPATIRVKHDARNYFWTDWPAGEVRVFPFDEYVSHVCAIEMSDSWPIEALRAQSIAARSYAWYYILHPPAPDYDITDWSPYQAMRPSPHPNCDLAAQSTAGQYLSYNGSIVYAMYSAENGDPTRDNTWGNPYLRAVEDPVGFAKDRCVSAGCSHGLGMSQWGAYRWASWYGWDYQKILMHYYTGVSVELPAAVVPPSPQFWGEKAAPSQPWGVQGVLSPQDWPAQEALSPQDWPAQGALSPQDWPAQEALSPQDWGVQGGQLLGSLVYPWSGWYVTGSRMFVQANASDAAGSLNSVTFAARFASGVTATIGSDASAAGGWSAAWDVGALPDQPITAPVVLSLTVRNAAGESTQGLPAIIGLDRSPPTVTAALDAPYSGVPTVTLRLSGGDVGSGLAGMAMSNDWLWEGEELPRHTGGVVSDSAALNGSAWRARVGVNPRGTVYGPFTTDLAAGQYRAYFRIKTTGVLTTAVIARLDVITTTGSITTLIGLHEVRGGDFRVSGEYQEMAVEFDYPHAGEQLEFRTHFLGVADLYLDRVLIVSYPRPFTATTLWNIGGAPPPHTVRVKSLDAAGNVSADAIVVVDVTPTTPTVTSTPTATPSAGAPTATNTAPAPTPSHTPTTPAATPTRTASATPTATASHTPPATPAQTHTASVTLTATPSRTPTISRTATSSGTATPTATASHTPTATPSPTASATAGSTTPTAIVTKTPTASAVASASRTPTLPPASKTTTATPVAWTHRLYLSIIVHLPEDSIIVW